MKIFSIAALIIVMACATKKNDPTPMATPASEDMSINSNNQEDCPVGVKTDCNVPTLSQTDIDKINEANRQCVIDCVSSRQTEAMAADLIQEQCQRGCDQKHFVGQVQVDPVLNEIESGPVLEEEEEDQE